MKRKNDRLPIFTERFRELQGEQSNTEFAEFLGISRQTVGFYWNGDRVPDAVTLIKIAEKCSVSTDWLLGLSDSKSTDIDTRIICGKTGLSTESVESLSDQKFNSDFVALLINNLISGLHSYQPAARFAARYWIQSELGNESKSKEDHWLEKVFCMMQQESDFRKGDHVRSTAVIDANDAGDFYCDRAVREIENIALRSIKEYKDMLKPEMERLREIPADIMKEIDSMQNMYLLAANAALRDVMGDEFKGVPELNDLEAELRGLQTNALEKPAQEDNE